MKEKIKSLVRDYYFIRVKSAERKQYGRMLTMNNIPNKKIAGEEEWVKRWSFGKYKPSVECFRMFANRLQMGGGKRCRIRRDVFSSYRTVA